MKPHRESFGSGLMLSQNDKGAFEIATKSGGTGICLMKPGVGRPAHTCSLLLESRYPQYLLAGARWISIQRDGERFQ